MSRFFVALSLMAITIGFADAQPIPGNGAGVRKPTTSPYLGLLANTGSPALNYAALVRPQQQLQQQLGQMQQQNILSNRAYDQALNKDLSTISQLLAPTGNVSVFNNKGNYFNRYGSSFSSLGGGGGASRGSFGAGSSGGSSRSSGFGAGLGGIGGSRR